MKQYKTIFHIDESRKWSLLLANVDNLLNDLGDDRVTIIVLANSAAVLDYVSVEENDIMDTVEKLSARGVTFKACRNTIKANKIEESTLPKEIEVVSAGVGELTKRQAEGYGYIKP